MEEWQAEPFHILRITVVREREHLWNRARFERRQNLAPLVDQQHFRHWQLLETLDEEQVGVER